MKTLILTISIAFIASFSITAQEIDSTIFDTDSIIDTTVVDNDVNTSKPDTTKIKIGKKKIIIIEDKENSTTDIRFDSDWNSYEDDIEYEFDDNEWNNKKYNRKFDGHVDGFFIGHNNFLNNNYQMQLPEDGEFLELNTTKSIEFGMVFGEQGVNLYHHNIGFVAGLGFKFNNYHFDKNITLISGNPISYDLDSVNYSKNKLATGYLTLPLAIEFQLPIGSKKDVFFLTLGGYGEVKVFSNTKQKYSDNGNQNKEKVKEDYNLNPFRYGIMAEAGYGDFGIYASYSFASFFEKQDGLKIYPLTIGIAFTDF